MFPLSCHQLDLCQGGGCTGSSWGGRDASAPHPVWAGARCAGRGPPAMEGLPHAKPPSYRGARGSEPGVQFSSKSRQRAVAVGSDVTYRCMCVCVCVHQREIHPCTLKSAHTASVIAGHPLLSVLLVPFASVLSRGRGELGCTLRHSHLEHTRPSGGSKLQRGCVRTRQLPSRHVRASTNSVLILRSGHHGPHVINAERAAQRDD